MKEYYACLVISSLQYFFYLVDAQCPNDWLEHDKYCYKHIDDVETWAEAKLNCARLGANLVSIHTTREEDFLMYLYRNRNVTLVWTGW